MVPTISIICNKGKTQMSALLSSRLQIKNQASLEKTIFRATSLFHSTNNKCGLCGGGDRLLLPGILQYIREGLTCSVNPTKQLKRVQLRFYFLRVKGITFVHSLQVFLLPLLPQEHSTLVYRSAVLATVQQTRNGTCKGSSTKQNE